MIANICETCASMAQGFLMIWFISNFCGYKYSGLKKALGFILILFLDTAVITVINHFTDYDGILSVISIFDMVIYARICLRGKLPEHIFSALFAMEIVFLIASLTSLIISNTHGESEYNLLAGFSGARLFILCFCRVAEFAVFKAVLYVRERCNLTLKEWIMCIAVLFITWVEVMLFTKASMMADNIKGYMLGAAVAAVAVNLLIYYFILRTNRAMEIKTELAIVKEQIKHYNDITAAQAQTRKLKHDLSNHIISIKSYVEDGKKEECLQYLDSLTDYADINSDVIDTGNSVIDAIFTAKRNLARERNIDFSADVQIPENLKINSSDCCVIFGNALDNAIEACDKVQGDKYIKVSLIYRDNSLMCKIVNSMSEAKNPLLKTTKADKINHGIGLKNIRETLNKYSHMLRVEQNTGEFVLSFIIYEVN